MRERRSDASRSNSSARPIAVGLTSGQREAVGREARGEGDRRRADFGRGIVSVLAVEVRSNTPMRSSSPAQRMSDFEAK